MKDAAADKPAGAFSAPEYGRRSSSAERTRRAGGLAPNAPPVSPDTKSGGGGNLIGTIRAGGFTRQEQLVAAFVGEHLEATIEMTIAELAAACAVSKPTVVRFCRSVACDGFRDFKLRLAETIARSRSKSPPDSGLEGWTGQASVEQVLAAFYVAAQAARDQIDRVRFERVRDLLATSRQLLFVGMGDHSGMVAREAANRFLRLGIPSSSQSDGSLLRTWPRALGPRDTLFAISASGETEAVLDAVAIAEASEARTICLTRPASRLAERAAYPLLVDLPASGTAPSPTALRYAQLIIIDALALAVQPVLSRVPNDA